MLPNEYRYKFKDFMVEHGLTLAVAESLTGGHVQYLMSSTNGSSNFFVGGVTAYNIDQKVNILKVDRKNAEKCNCVSSQTAIEMAQGVQQLMGSDYGLSTTGYSVTNDSVDEPYAYVALYDKKRDNSEFIKIINRKFTTREESQVYFSDQAMLFFYAYVLVQEGAEK